MRMTPSGWRCLWFALGLTLLLGVASLLVQSSSVSLLSSGDETPALVINDAIRLLPAAGLAAAEAAAPATAPAQPALVRVALLTSPGTSERSWSNTKAVLECFAKQVEVTLVQNASRALITRRHFDVLFVPGGVAQRIARWYRANGDDLKATTRRFLKSGGGYVGVCAGAHLASQPAFAVSPFQPATSMLGFGVASGVELLWDAASAQPPKSVRLSPQAELFYANGPIYRPLADEEAEPLPPFIRHPGVLLRFAPGPRARLALRSPNKDRAHSARRSFAGLSLLVTNEFDAGRVVLSSTHPETDASDAGKAASACDSEQALLLRAMVLLAAGQ